MLKPLLVSLSLGFLLTACASAPKIQASDSFTTLQNSLRNIVTAKVNGESIIYLSELDGGVSSYTLEGKQRWAAQSQNKAVMFEIQAVDINGDNNQDLLAASGDGQLYAWDSSGELLWQFKPAAKVRFSEIAVINNGQVQIFAGGNDQNLYELDANGHLVSTTPLDGLVRVLDSGDFLGEGKQSLFVMTIAHDKFRWESLSFINPDNKKRMKSTKYQSGKYKKIARFMLTDFAVADTNNDGKDELLWFGDSAFLPMYFTMNDNFDLTNLFVGDKQGRQRYAHSQGVYIADKNKIFVRHGSMSYLLDSNANLLEQHGSIYENLVFNDFALEPSSNTLYAAGVVGGGNSVYTFDLNDENGWKKEHTVIGRMAEVERNLNTLYQQTLNFTLPDYQTKAEEPWVMVAGELSDEVKQLKGAAVHAIMQQTWYENTDRSELVNKIGKIALQKDRRGKYNLTRAQIIEKAKALEKSNTPFILWAGHVTDPFYLQIETMEQILKVAPNACRGFLYAEMHDPKDPRVVHFVEEYIPRLAKAIRKEGRAKIYFRYKNVFWAITSHISPWKEMFHSGKYADILVPASEDTSSRTQDINLAGRIGMLASGSVNDFAMRLIDDNPTSWRPLTPGGQKSASPYLRQGALMAAYGAHHGVLFNNRFVGNGKSNNILMALMASGVMPMVEAEDILSIGNWHLIDGVDDKLIHSIDDHHNVLQYQIDDNNAVFSVSQMHWAGTNLPEHDFSKIALGVDYRWLNYLPTTPNGMSAIGSVAIKPHFDKAHMPYTVSDAKYGLVNGKKVKAADFAGVLKQTVRAGATKLPVTVDGAAWSAMRLDENHMRIVLIDPGYIDPQQRNVVINFNTNLPVNAVDILTGEKLSIKQQMQLTVPAGSMRFIDLTYAD